MSGDIMEESGESQNSSLMMGPSSALGIGPASSYPDNNHHFTSASRMESQASYKAETNLQTYPTRQMNYNTAGTGALAFPIEASTQTPDHPNNNSTTSFDEQQQHCGVRRQRQMTDNFLPFSSPNGGSHTVRNLSPKSTFSPVSPLFRIHESGRRLGPVAPSS